MTNREQHDTAIARYREGCISKGEALYVLVKLMLALEWVGVEAWASDIEASTTGCEE